jgi:hypothetical protein
MTTQVRADSLHQIRQSGATLQQIASLFGISREGARQRLFRHYGSTRIQGLLTAAELARLAGCTYRYIEKLQRRGAIQPAMVVGQGRTLWEPGTVAAVIIHIDRLRCPVCHRPVPSNRQTYCSKECYIEAHRYKNRSELEKSRHNERVARWLAEHQEQARQIQQRSQARYRARKSVERYHSTEYIIWRRCLIPLGTVVRVLSLDSARGRMKVEWGDQVLEVPFGCVKRINGVINYG